MAISLVQTKTQNSAGAYTTTRTIVPTSQVGAGRFLLLCIGTTGDHAAVSTVTDSASNTWTKWLGFSPTNSNPRDAEVWFTVTGGAATPTITATADSTVAWAMVLREYSGVAASSMQDVSATSADGAYQQSHSVSTSTAATAGDLIVSGLVTSSDASIFSVGSGYGNLASIQNPGAFLSMAIQDKTITTTATQSASMATSNYDQGQSFLVAIKPSISSTPGTPTGINADIAATSINLTWSPPVGATSYKVKRSTVASGPYTTVGTPSAATYNDTGLTTNTPYYYVISAVNSFGEGANSAEYRFVPVASTASSWYGFGAQPTGKTLASIAANFKTKYNEAKAFMLKQDGMKSGMPAGAWRVAVPDQASSGVWQVNGTFSEGMGYWLFITAICSRVGSPIYDPQAKAIFDGLWTYYKFYKDRNGLMDWRIEPDGSNLGAAGPGGNASGGATDGDQDAAFGLVLMSRIQGNAGAINYGSEATTLINAIDQFEFLPSNHPQYPNLMKSGDQWGDNENMYMPDYARYAAWKEFGIHTGNTTRWNAIIAANKTLATTYFYTHYTTGYVPDGCARDGTPSWLPYKYGYNSIRMPWSLTLDYLWNGDATTGNAVKRLATAENTRAAGVPDNARAEGALDASSFGSYINAAYMGGFTVAGASQSSTAQWAADGIDWIMAHSEQNYFGINQALIALLILTGEFKPYSSYSPTPPPDPGPTPNPTPSGSSILEMWNGTAWVQVTGLTIGSSSTVTVNDWPLPAGWNEVVREEFKGDLSNWVLYDDATNPIDQSFGRWRSSQVNIATVNGIKELQLTMQKTGSIVNGGGCIWVHPEARKRGGRWEYRIKYDTALAVGGVGQLWVADEATYNPWPTYGEFDITEWGGGNRDGLELNIHYSTVTDSPDHDQYNGSSALDFNAGFHDIAFEWEPGVYTAAWCDGVKYHDTRDGTGLTYQVGGSRLVVPANKCVPMNLIFQQDFLDSSLSNYETTPKIMHIQRCRYLAKAS